MHRYWDSCCNWMSPWGITLSIIGFILLLVLVIVIVMHFLKSNPHPGGTSPALDIAKIRLAKGEITQEEFEEIKKTLEN